MRFELSVLIAAVFAGCVEETARFDDARVLDAASIADGGSRDVESSADASTPREDASTAHRDATNSLDGPLDGSIDGSIDAGVVVEPLPEAEAIGGPLTIDRYGDAPFLTPAAVEEVILGPFSIGRELFVADWLVAPNAQRPTIDGLGPLMHAASCLACHPRTGRPEALLEDGAVGIGVLFRLASATSTGGDAIFGAQLQPSSIAGVPAEASIRYVRDASGIEFSFETNAAYGALGADTEAGARLSPHLTGLGLLELAAEAVILERDDPEDRDGDGISGRAAWITTEDGVQLGRFGWKAIKPTLRAQSAAAFAGDLGIASPDRPHDDCTLGQAACRASISGGEPELGAAELDAVAFFMRYLGVPAARREGDDPQAIRGNEVFHELGCAACHRPTLVTSAASGDPALAGIVFHPYTDLLLHDLGPGLSDRVGEGAAFAEEWRTPPLWGLGLVAADPQARFLHDGRAATLEEAILEHGGEAAGARARFATLAPADAEALAVFLRGL